MTESSIIETGSKTGSTSRPTEGTIGVGLSVADQLRGLIAKRGSGLICWQDLADSTGDNRAVVQLALSNLTLNRYGPDRNIPVQRVAQGVYHYGYGNPDPYQVALKLAGGSPEGVGYGAESAAHYLGLREQKPAKPIIAFPRRVRSQPSGLKAQWVSRAAAIGRVAARLNLPAVAVLETLRDPELITIVPAEAVSKISSLLDREQFSTGELVKASETEPAVVREGVKNLLFALDRPEAERIKPSLNRAVADRAFLGQKTRGLKS